MEAINHKNQHSFSKQAHSYMNFADIQKQIIKKILIDLPSNIKSIADIGCGSGNVALELETLDLKICNFTAIDISQKMLDLHPKKIANIKNIIFQCQDFENISIDNHDLIIASSSLQWAKNLKKTLCNLSNKAKEFRLSIHTNKSLESIHNFLGTKSPLRDKSEILEILKEYFIGEIWVESLEKTFLTRKDMLNHLKYSGLLGGGVLDYRQAKLFKENVPYERIEYEVVMFIGKSAKL